jgi:EAL domain-containing protein (putative c-di-GMP-specific phosphodiesterase class I)
MRWHHPKRGMISPSIFIPLAERFGLIGSLGSWGHRRSLSADRRMARWRTAHAGGNQAVGASIAPA